MYWVLTPKEYYIKEQYSRCQLIFTIHHFVESSCLILLIKAVCHVHFLNNFLLIEVHTIFKKILFIIHKRDVNKFFSK